MNVYTYINIYIYEFSQYFHSCTQNPVGPQGFSRKHFVCKNTPHTQPHMITQKKFFFNSLTFDRRQLQSHIVSNQCIIYCKGPVYNNRDVIHLPAGLVYTQGCIFFQNYQISFLMLWGKNSKISKFFSLFLILLTQKFISFPQFTKKL